MSRWWPRAVLLAIVILAIASVSFSCGRTLVIRDMAGTPIQDAYVAYHREGTTFAVVEALTYQASPIALLTTDAAGRAAIPPAIHVHWPLVQGRPEIDVNLVYAPSLHNGLAWVNRRVG